VLEVLAIRALERGLLGCDDERFDVVVLGEVS